ncbi:MAG: Xaa-Pro aminopeptidase (EC [uncultured Paraburkholderia sp.]|nr:MAG: Xaa-Pro aminopeptidase (EC [uncultured Paraburkholderia sp.]
MNARLPQTSSIPERLASLRSAMAREGVAAYLVPSADPHLSEYLPGRWQGREWRLSGFTGSAGTLVVTADFAGVWTDSRYWEQANAQLAGSGVQLMKMTGGQQTAPHSDWLAENVASGGTVGVAAARGVKLRTDVDLFDGIWPQRPSLPDATVFEHAAPHASVARSEKLAQIRRVMAEKGAQWHFISTLDDLAWLFNLRGADVSFNPVFVAHALIGEDHASLFIADGKVPPALAEALARDGVNVEPYAKAADALAALPAGSTLLIDPRRITYGSLQSVPSLVKVVEAVNPSTFFKSRKTGAEAQHVRETMEQEGAGAALAEFFAWFEGALGRETITELTIDERLTAARARRPGFVSLSFATIAGFNANGAMPHYRATQESHSVIEGNGLLLIDSGAQYLSGTTDITRVVPIGTISDEQRRDFTIVLKGTMALSRAQFPRGIRAPIWEAGADYGHGTGHGVGYFLNVHEGPQVISHYAPAEPWTAMEEGMITSVEPGIYRPGKWGVRIENLVLNVPAGQTEFGDFLKFETLTLCPIDTRCLDLSLPRDDERAWLNDYHHTVRTRLAPHVSGDAKAWLELRTQPI